MSSASPSAPLVTDLSPTALTQLPEPPLIIDVRSALEFRAGHVPAARNLSLPRLLLGLGGWRWLLPQWFRQLSHEHAIAVICLTAHRSPIAAERLAKAGFTQIYNVTGGLLAWRRQEGEPDSKSPSTTL